MKLYDDNVRKIVTKHPTCVDVGECRPPHRATKATRHWCKGRVGIPHTWEWQRSRNDLEREGRMGLTYNRITEQPVCFGCDKVDFRFRHYCRQCGEPWEKTFYRAGEVAACTSCGAPWIVRHPRAHAWRASGSVVR